MAWISAGTVAVTNGSTQVDGTSTSWLGSVNQGDGFIGPDGRLYEVADVVSNVRLTLGSNYTGSSSSGQAYRIFPTQGLVRSLTVAVTNLINTINAAISSALAGRFGAGTVSAPGVANDADVDTGLFWPAANTLSIGTGGTERIMVDSAVNVRTSMVFTASASQVQAASAGAFTINAENAAGFVALRAAGANRLSATSTGVGIGTDTPSESLAIVNSTQPAIHLRRDGTNEWFLTATATGANRLSFRTGTNDAAAEKFGLDTSGNMILSPSNTAPSLTNGQMVFTLTSNTNLRISVRGSDGTTRVANITLA